MAPTKIYDPGGSDDSADDSADDDALDGLDCIVLCIDALLSAVDVLTPRPAAFREGEFTVNGVVSRMFNVLWDSGACHRSYVS